MNMQRIALALAATFFCAGALAQEDKPVDTTPKLTNGLLMKQGGKLVFAPCRDRSYAIVEDVSSGGSITQALNGIGLEAGKKLYVELVGVVEGINLRASSLNFARAEGRCQAPGGAEEHWRAAGNEPGWNLVVGGGKVSVQRKGRPELSTPASPFKIEGALATYEASEGPNKLSLRFEKTVCRDKVADVLLGWTATVTVNGETLKGCAWQR